MQVTNNLFLEVPSSGDAVETSRVLPTQGNTLFAVVVLVGSMSPGTLNVKAQLQWSNDMDNWMDVSGATGDTTSAPKRIVFDNMSASASQVAGAFLRLWYTVSGSIGSTASIVSADIDVKSN